MADGLVQPGSTEKKTFIELYSIPEKRRMLIYTHPGRINVVNCSVNKERTLLVFTIYGRYDKADAEGSYDDIYENCLVEIQPQNRLFKLGQPSTKIQRVQVRPWLSAPQARSVHADCWCASFSIRTLPALAASRPRCALPLPRTVANDSLASAAAARRSTICS